MRFLLGGKNTVDRLRKRTSQRRQPARRFSLHGLEQLEARSMLTAAPFVGPLLPAQPPDEQLAVALASTPIASQAEASAAAAVNAFALDLYRQLQSEAGGSGNMFISPMSNSAAMAMLYAGARGATAQQIAAVMHFGGDQAAVASQFGSLLRDLNAAGQSDYALSIADALWSQLGTQINPEFADLMNREFAGRLYELDFRSLPDQSRQIVNDWVADQTNDKIKDLFSPDAINAATRLVLANAIYFKGDWAQEFDPARTHDANFRLANGDFIQVPMMNALDDYRYMQRDGFQVVELPYAGDRLVMDILLPDAASGAAGLSVDRLSTDWQNWFDGLSSQQVQLLLPKFKMTTDFQLASPLKALGMSLPLSDSADYSGLSQQEQLAVQQIVHKAYVGVDESGAEAAAATGISMVTTDVISPSRGPIVFNADHPFLFVIRDKVTGSVLFLGQVANPTSESKDSSAPAIEVAAASSQDFTPLDALRVINYMIRQNDPASAASLAASGPAPDYNDDGVVSPLDLLMIYNDIARKNAPPPPSFTIVPIQVFPIEPSPLPSGGSSAIYGMSIDFEMHGELDTFLQDTLLPDWLHGAEVRSS